MNEVRKAKMDNPFEDETHLKIDYQSETYLKSVYD
jgi:hypothetical protein